MPSDEPRSTVTTTVDLTKSGRFLLEQFGALYGLSIASVIEMLVRDGARREGIRIPSDEDLAALPDVDPDAIRLDGPDPV
jgi:hypothetical protein